MNDSPRCSQMRSSSPPIPVRGLDELRTAVESLLPVPHVHVNALLPYTAGSLISRVREYGKVDKVEYRDDGIQLEADVDAHLAAQVVEQSID